MAIRNRNGTAGADWINAATLPGGDSARSFLYEGDDRFDGSAGDDSALGGAGNDVLLGYDGHDTLLGGDGNDILQGGLGADSMDGGDGDDVAQGGEGNDRLKGGAGRDNLWGDAGHDTIEGGDGDDTLTGGEGNDSLAGGAGADRLDGGLGDDTLAAGEGDNVADGGDGNDLITAASGNDVLSGGAGNDVIRAGAGRNTVHAGAGNDRVETGSGDDAITGDDGDDVILAGDGANTVHAGLGNDRVETGSGNDAVTGDDGDDAIGTGRGNDTVHAGNGADSLTLGDGDDVGTGDAGDDTVLGGDGRDSVHGGAGNDLLNGGKHADLILGDDGNDLVVQAISDVGPGRDTLHGGAGTDTLRFAFTTAQWFDLANQTELARVVGLMGTANVINGGAVNTAPFGATFQGFESLSASVNGVILSAEDDPVTAGDDLFTIGESGSVSASVLGNDTVPDLVRDVALVGPAPMPGTFSLSAAGLMAFATSGAFESLGAGVIQDLTFTYRVRDADLDGDTALATIRIVGENDAAGIAGLSAATVTEDTSPTTVGGTLTLTDVDAGEAVFRTPTNAALSGTYGTFSFDPLTGAWSYALDNARAATQALDTGVNPVESLTVTSFDGTASRTIEVTVRGRNDAPVHVAAGSTGDFTVTERADGALDENAGAITVAGRVMNFTDADAADTHAVTFPLQNGPGLGTPTLASLTSSVAGSLGTVIWDFAVAAGALDTLAGGETVTDRYRVRVSDGDANTSQLVTVRLVGSNDAVAFTGGETGTTLTDGDVLETAGDLAFADPDLRDTHVLSVSGPGAAYGTFGATITEGNDGDGIGSVGWSFTADEDAVRALGANESVTLTYTLSLTDRNLGVAQTTATQDVTITLHGVNDAPTSVQLIGTPAVDEGTAGLGGRFVAVVAGFDPDATDNLTFTVSDPRFEVAGGALFLREGESLDFETEPSVALTITATDPHGESVSADFTVAVNDMGDARSLNGQMLHYIYNYPDLAGVYWETDLTPGAGIDLPQIYIQVNDTSPATLDVEGDRLLVDFSFSSTFGGGTPFNGFRFLDQYGNLAPIVGFEIVGTNMAGLDASDLSVGENFVGVNWGGLSFDANTFAEFRIIFAEVGPNHAATIGGANTGAVTEDAAGNTVGGTLTIADTDPGEELFAPVAPAALNGTYGTFTFDNETGAWTYTLDNARAATQALGAGVNQADTLAISSFDGSTTETLTVTVNGTNDAPVGAGARFGTVEEDGNLEASGVFTFADADMGENRFRAPDPASLAGRWGDLAFDTDTGAWTYTLDNSRAATQGLAPIMDAWHLPNGPHGYVPPHEVFELQTLDGTGAAIIVWVTPASDPASITGISTATVTEDDVVTTVGSTLTVTDADYGHAGLVPMTLPSLLWGSITRSDLNGTYGRFSYTGDGEWTYVLDNTRTATQALGAGETGIDQLVVESLDESASVTLVVTVEGMNDAPTSVTLIDNNGVDEGTAGPGGTLIGTLTGVDPDAGDTLTYAVNDARFAVVGDKLYLKEGASLDHESEPSVALTLTATDAGGLSTSSNVTLAVGDVAERHNPVVGVYDGVGWSTGTGSAGFATYVSSLGLTPVLLSDNPTPAQLSSLDAVVTDTRGSLDADIMPAVLAGLNLVVNDWYVNFNIIGAALTASLALASHNGQDVNIIDEGSWIASGPGGRLTDSSLDGGASSAHNAFTLASVLANGATPILSSISDSNVTGFEIGYGAGKILYTAMPVSAYIGSVWVSQGINDGMQAFFRNEIANAVRQPGATRTGDAADNVLSGGDGDDVLSGGGGNDILSGGLGFDRLTGGAGADRFVFGGPANMTDVVSDFLAGEDLIVLSASGFGGQTPGAIPAALFTSNTTGAATTAAHRFIYETDSRVLWFDPDGTGLSDPTMILRLDNGASLAASDLLLV